MGKITYSTDSHVDCNVAEDDDGQGEEATCNHKNNHVGLDSGVFTSTEHIRSAGGLQPVRPVSDGGKKKLVSANKFKHSSSSVINTVKHLDTVPAPSKNGGSAPACCPNPGEDDSSCGPFAIKLDISKRLAHNHPSLPGDDSQGPQSSNTCINEENSQQRK